MVDDLRPFRVEIPDADLTDLQQRLDRTRWPERATVPDRSQGVPLDYLTELCRYWRDEYDWRATEARLNRIPQFITTVDGLPIHALHVRSAHPDAVPVLGWWTPRPGSAPGSPRRSGSGQITRATSSR